MLVGCIDGNDRGMAGREAFFVRVRIPGAGEEDDVLVALPLDGFDGLANPALIVSGDTKRRKNNVGKTGLACPEYGLYIRLRQQLGTASSGQNPLVAFNLQARRSTRTEKSFYSLFERFPGWSLAPWCHEQPAQ